MSETSPTEFRPRAPCAGGVCAFCSRPEAEAGPLVEGPAGGGALICGRCARLCASAFETDKRPAATVRRDQFSLRSLLVVMFVLCCLLALARVWPHVVILLVSMALAAGATALALHARRGAWPVASRAVSYAAAALTWIALYVVSIGPVIALGHDVLGVDQDVFELLYSPVIWLHDATPLEEPIEWYAALWGI